MRLFLFISLFISTVLYAQDWPQAFGPNDDFTVNGKAVDSFSVSMNENILWRTKMPSTGQG
ncbi:MAG: hypothetical protein P8P49_01755, partial [Opitutales bacterium]|nr:hypothetical protein [Opitutales bacterium]